MVRARVIALRSHLERDHLPIVQNREVYERPIVRQDCIDGCNAARPCPWVSCRYNLYLDSLASGGVKVNFPKREPEDMPCSCVLDAAEQGEKTLAETGDLMNLTRERCRQIVERALAKLAKTDRKLALELKRLLPIEGRR
jgi:hypothetical protein